MNKKVPNPGTDMEWEHYSIEPDNALKLEELLAALFRCISRVYEGIKLTHLEMSEAPFLRVLTATSLHFLHSSGTDSGKERASHK